MEAYWTWIHVNVTVLVYTPETTAKYLTVIIWKMMSRVILTRVVTALNRHVDGQVLNKNAHFCAVHVYQNLAVYLVVRNV